MPWLDLTLFAGQKPPGVIERLPGNQQSLHETLHGPKSNSLSLQVSQLSQKSRRNWIRCLKDHMQDTSGCGRGCDSQLAKRLSSKRLNLTPYTIHSFFPSMHLVSRNLHLKPHQVSLLWYIYGKASYLTKLEATRCNKLLLEDLPTAHADLTEMWKQHFPIYVNPGPVYVYTILKGYSLCLNY